MIAKAPIRVLLAEDSPTIRRHLATLIGEMPGITVIGEASNGEDALALAHELRPDVISMDVRMPGMDGLEATRRIMTECPTPVVIVSSMAEHDVELSFHALQAGALAVVPKPPDRGDMTFAEKQRQLVKTLVAMADVRVISRRQRFESAQAYSQSNGSSPEAATAFRRSTHLPEVIAIGASAGGPSALTTLLGELPADFPVPILIVQHMLPEFLPGLARWLDKSTPLAVRMATEGNVLKPGVVNLSQGDVHLIVDRRETELVSRMIRDRRGYRYQPAIDVLFESVAQVCGAQAVGIILTGMGDDGAEGLLAMRQAGMRTIAQNEASSTVFGMPAAAIERGAVERVLPLSAIARALMDMVNL